MTYNMKCPKCAHELVKKFYKGMFEVESCPNCRGMWLDFYELDKLEDIVFEDDEHKGSLVHFQKQTEYPCPHCGKNLDEFQYRLFDLKLDTCTVNDHGFWLDAGEDERVMDLMQKRSENIQRKLNAEVEWKQMLKGLHSFLGKRK